MIIKKLKYALTTTLNYHKVDKLILDEKFEEASIYLDSFDEQRKKFISFYYRYIESLYFSNEKKKSLIYYNELIGHLIDGIKKDKIRKCELAWVYEYCLNRYGFKYYGISDHISANDRDQKCVRKSLKSKFPMKYSS